MNTPQTATCPCCLNEYHSLDNAVEYMRVKSWSPGSQLGKRNAGKPRHITDATRQARIATLAKWRASRAMPKGSEL